MQGTIWEEEGWGEASVRKTVFLPQNQAVSEGTVHCLFLV